MVKRLASAGKSKGRPKTSTCACLSAILAIPRRLVTPLPLPLQTGPGLSSSAELSRTYLTMTSADRHEARPSFGARMAKVQGCLSTAVNKPFYVHTRRIPLTPHSAGGTLCVKSSRTWLLRVRSRGRTRRCLTRSPSPTSANQYRTRRSETFRTKQHRLMIPSTRVLHLQAAHRSPTTDPENLQPGAAGMAARGD